MHNYDLHRPTYLWDRDGAIIFAITIAGGRFIPSKHPTINQEYRILGVAHSLLGGLTFNNYVYLMKNGESKASVAVISPFQILELRNLENQCIKVVDAKSNFEYKKIP